MKVLLIFSLVLFTLGCTLHQATIDLKPVNSELPVPYNGELKNHKTQGYFENFNVTMNNNPVNSSDGFKQRFITSLKDTKIFNSIKQEAPEQKAVRFVDLSLTVNEREYPNQGANVFKGMIIGLSFYILTPIITLSYDFESDMILSATRWDGQNRKYMASGKGYSSYQLYANRVELARDVSGQVTNNNINSIMNQIVQDAGFFIEDVSQVSP